MVLRKTFSLFEQIAFQEREQNASCEVLLSIPIPIAYS